MERLERKTARMIEMGVKAAEREMQRQGREMREG